MSSNRLDFCLTTVLSISAVALASIAVRREFFPSEQRAPRTDPPVIEAQWKDALPIGIRIGESAAPVTLVVFSDLECPACAAFHETMREVLREHKKELSVVFVHFPLGIHRFAVPAAQAAECASAQGRFERFIDVVYAKQDSLGIKTWGAYAHEAGIADTASITRCARDPSSVPRVDAGRALALQWALSGTPTVIINGWRYENPPTASEIGRVIREVQKGSSRSAQYSNPAERTQTPQKPAV